MTIYIEVELRCDGAGGPYNCEPSIFANTAVRARKEALDTGWLVNRPGGKDYCARPEHRPAGA
jgi:hypothetical protein